jgi:hypothetical protein
MDSFLNHLLSPTKELGRCLSSALLAPVLLSACMIRPTGSSAASVSNTHAPGPSSSSVADTATSTTSGAVVTTATGAAADGGDIKLGACRRRGLAERGRPYETLVDARDFAIAPDGGRRIEGRIEPEVIQRIIRQGYGRLRDCYEEGLRRDPNLKGRVAVQFVIGRDGGVAFVHDGGSDLPDSATLRCMLSIFWDFCFPQPKNGIVTVVYPIMFSPGG